MEQTLERYITSYSLASLPAFLPERFHDLLPYDLPRAISRYLNDWFATAPRHEDRTWLLPSVNELSHALLCHPFDMTEALEMLAGEGRYKIFYDSFDSGVVVYRPGQPPSWTLLRQRLRQLLPEKPLAEKPASMAG